ncbi:hypothetical protein JCM10450v2_002313 [Rhodotorula kratochvilovae]
MQRRSSPALALLVLALLAACLTASAVPLTPALNRRQDLSTLNIDAGKPGPVYRTNTAVNCSTYDLKLTGQPAAGSTPFLVDAIRAPYDPRLPSAQEVLVRVGSYADLTTVQWADDVPAGERFVFRLTDARGNVRYSTEKISEEAPVGPLLAAAQDAPPTRPPSYDSAAK